MVLGSSPYRRPMSKINEVVAAALSLKNPSLCVVAYERPKVVETRNSAVDSGTFEIRSGTEEYFLPALINESGDRAVVYNSKTNEFHLIGWSDRYRPQLPQKGVHDFGFGHLTLQLQAYSNGNIESRCFSGDDKGMRAKFEENGYQI